MTFVTVGMPFVPGFLPPPNYPSPFARLLILFPHPDENSSPLASGRVSRMYVSATKSYKA